MPKPRVPGTGSKIKLSITLDPTLFQWIEERTGPGKEFANVSHALERSIAITRMVLATDRRLVEDILQRPAEKKRPK